MVQNRYKQIYYTSFKDFLISMINDDIYQGLDNYIFRGEDSDLYELVPSALREDGIKKLELLTHFKDNTGNACGKLITEYAAVLNFYKTAKLNGLHIPEIHHLNIDLSDFHTAIETIQYPHYISKNYYELFALAQHYGIPTRFLDWTFDINVALYFATHKICKSFVDCHMNGNDFSEGKFVIWMLNYKLIENIGEKQQIQFIIPKYSENPNLNAQRGLLSYLDEKITKESLKSNTYAVQPLNIYIDNNQAYKNCNCTLIYKLSFPYTASLDAFQYLLHRGYSKSRLYPGYHSIIDDIQENNLWGYYSFWLFLRKVLIFTRTPCVYGLWTIFQQNTSAWVTKHLCCIGSIPFAKEPSFLIENRN